jgi:hydrogenase/urease accessory protein HupE
VRAVLVCVILAAAAALPSQAAAHPVGLSRSELDVSGREVAGRLRASARELGVSPDGATSGGDPVAATLGAIRVLQGGAACPFAPGAFVSEPPDGFLAEGRWTCSAPIGRLDVEVGFLATAPPGHTHVARVRAGGVETQHVARAGEPRFAIEAPEPAWRRAAAFVRLGVEHILSGLDHLAFLLAVLLGAPSLRRVVQLVTSFTVAHSLTLAAAALGAFTVSPRIVEPLIAASVAAVALENLWLLRAGASPAARERGLRRRWLLTFAFGLVHGLGFAGALEALALARGDLALALVSFNVGVELGQVAVTATVVPLLALVRRSSATVARATPRLGSAALAALGVLWLAERVVLAR